MSQTLEKTGPNVAAAAPAYFAPYLRSKKKRCFDVLVGFFGLLVTAVGFPFIALLIKMDSRGPVLYRQARLGIDGRPFVLIKFRTMIHNAEKISGPVWSAEDDPRVTRVGKLIRTIYIDELPQWWNVIKGDMSVVGPRPERVELAEVVAERVPNFDRRLLAKPGITGLAQTEYRYANSIVDSRHKLNYDVRYINKASLIADAWIVARTIRRMLLRRGT